MEEKREKIKKKKETELAATLTVLAKLVRETRISCIFFFFFLLLLTKNQLFLQAMIFFSLKRSNKL